MPDVRVVVLDRVVREAALRVLLDAAERGRLVRRDADRVRVLELLFVVRLEVLRRVREVRLRLRV